MKRCMKCGGKLPLSEFYKHPGMSDGHLNKCKTCTKRDVRENREKNADYYREYEKRRAADADRVAAREAYQRSDAGRAAVARAKRKYIQRNPKKRKAHHALSNAIRDGKIERPDDCEECGVICVPHGHHDDYSHPLKVRWLCTQCHNKWHEENGPGKNGDQPT